MYEDLKEHIGQHIGRCRGDWVAKRSGYESGLCAALGFQRDENRYHDAVWDRYLIELKKGTSIWLDLVRYSEVLIKKTELNTPKNIALFCVPDKGKSILTHIIAVSTPALLRKLALSETQAREILELNNHVPRQLNALASLTLSDVRSIADFSVGLLDGML